MSDENLPEFTLEKMKSGQWTLDELMVLARREAEMRRHWIETGIARQNQGGSIAEVDYEAEGFERIAQILEALKTIGLAGES